ncbi:MAG: DEAD/DEAH box helicase [Gemmatimonadota bacterium]
MTDADPPKTFSELGLSEAAQAAVEALGWTHPTPIQTLAIPAAMEGRDVVGIAQTGTGKTGAFILPALDTVKAGGGLQVLVLCPTRELAQQVAEDTEALSKGTNLRVQAIYGGVKYGPQNEALAQGYEVIAATPGRFIDHLERGNAKLENVHTLILDEADRMLDMGFRPQIEAVIRHMRGSWRTMLFSATMPHGVHDLALRLTDEPVWVEATPSGTTARGITERIYPVKPEKKPDLLVHLLEDPAWDQVLVFTRTKAAADVLQARLERQGIKTAVMHSDRGMGERTRALAQFADGKVRVLVATDVAQRGLDVEGITHVVNYDVPTDPEDYVHRIGRTARAGATGTAITFVTAGDLGHLRSLELHLKRDLEREHLPDYDYAGAPQEDRSRGGPRGRHSRAPRGMGARSTDELSPEELADLLNFN